MPVTLFAAITANAVRRTPNAAATDALPSRTSAATATNAHQEAAAVPLMPANLDGGHCPANTNCGSCKDGSGDICCYGPGEFSSVGFGETALSSFTTPPATSSPRPTQTTAPGTSSTVAAGAGGVASTGALEAYTTTYTYYYTSYFYSQQPSSASLATTRVSETTVLEVSATASYVAVISLYDLATSVRSEADSSASRQSLALTSPTASPTLSPAAATGSGGTAASEAVIAAPVWLWAMMCIVAASTVILVLEETVCGSRACECALRTLVRESLHERSRS
ncbi:hypothetical protein B0A48_07303 [Cryoendolithus antarcticus]|uniref:Uncharacterized protein n=1 Tax=Cryoendolithus antarcticus TaxID=1507870 RepID=A0A1V8T857_9PEZI|nr:hypothetical protein B0A48_07303 [Cryoendolithus antarcticus]